jgi:dihydrolipoamide dehydrogenase
VKHVLVLGGGPAGYVAALRAAQLGTQVTMIEAREVGGTCLNRGCIPTKAMVASVERLRLVREGVAFGVRAGDVAIDFAAISAHKEQATRTLREGVEHLLKAHKVEVVRGDGRLAGARSVALDDGSMLKGDAVILASGSEPMRLPAFDFCDPRVMTSDEILCLDDVPASLVVVGGGAIGCEFASIFAGLGSKVTIIEMLDQLLPGEDKRAARTLQQAFRKASIEVRVGTTVEEMTGGGEGDVLLALAGGEQVSAARVLVSVGRRALSRGLGYEEAGVQLDGAGFVVADDTLRTAVDGVFAAGDLAGPPLLAHWAYHEGAVAAENAVTGARLEVDRRIVPACVFSHPEVASCGITEDRAAAAGLEVDIASLRFNGNARAVIEAENDGYVRILTERGSGVVLGASLVGPRVTELVHEIALAAQQRLPLRAIAETIHAHPTLSEAIGEAALASLGRGSHSL